MNKERKLNRGLACNSGFMLDDFRDVNALIKRLQSPGDKVSVFFLSKFSELGKIELWKASNSPADVSPDSLKPLLALEFNSIVNGEPFYEELIRTGFKPSRYARRLFRKSSSNAERARLHKALLREAFPAELERSPGRGKSHLQKHPKVYKLGNGKFAVYVRLVEPRRLEGKMQKAGAFKRELSTRALADAKCAEIDAELFELELARQLSQEEITRAKELFWTLLEPKHPDWVEHLPELVLHAEVTDFRVHTEELPTVDAAARLYYEEKVQRMETESRRNCAYVLGYIMAQFGRIKSNQLTDEMLIGMIEGTGPLKYLGKQWVRNNPNPEGRWNVLCDSKIKRPMSPHMKYNFLSVARAFKNWMHGSRDPKTRKPRLWSQRSIIETALNASEIAKEASIRKARSLNKDPIDFACERNPALTIPQVQALIDAAFVVFDGVKAGFFVHALWCGSRVKEVTWTSVASFDSDQGLLITPEYVDKMDTGRESELYENAIIMVEALRSAGLYTNTGFQLTQTERAIIQYLAGFEYSDKLTVSRGEAERKRLAEKGIHLPNCRWGIKFPHNALRRTALSMHYKLFMSVRTTEAWGGTGVFQEYYKRLVSKEQSGQYWRILPFLLKGPRLEVHLPAGHKLDTKMTKQVKRSICRACNTMKVFTTVASAKESESRATKKAEVAAHLAAYRRAYNKRLVARRRALKNAERIEEGVAEDSAPITAANAGSE